MNYKLTLLLLFPVISACTPKYIQPIDGDIARITLKQNQGIKFVAFTYDNAESCSGRKMIKNVHLNEDTSVSVLANRDTSITLSWDIGVYGLGSYVGCVPTITFKPEKNKLYEISPSYELKQCGLKLVEVSGSELQEVEYQTRYYLQGSFESSSFCG